MNILDFDRISNTHFSIYIDFNQKMLIVDKKYSHKKHFIHKHV